MRSAGLALLDLAERAVRGWTARLTDGLDAEPRRTRLDEVASDLHEHRAAFRARGVSPGRIGLSMLLRLAKGAPADLRWRLLAVGPPARSAPLLMRRRTTMSEHAAEEQRWRPLPDAHRFNQLNDVVDVTSDPVDGDAGEQDRAVARAAANIAAGVSAGGLQ